MIFQRLYDPKLAQASYVIGSHATGEALVVDPNRNIEQYLQVASAEGLRIAHVTETHIHADFVSGARELAHSAKARLYLSDAGGADWKYQYAADSQAIPLRDGSCLRIGEIDLRCLHVPGHTPEHLVFLVTDTETAPEPMGAFTGDFIFVGDVGRPDLLERSVRAHGTMVEGARQLYRSLQRFRPLPDFLQIWPGHGAGSACGKTLGAVPQSTLGYEKRFNWAFGIAEEDTFVREVLAGQPEPPRYFAEMKRINRLGPPLLGRFRRPARLPAEQLRAVLGESGWVVDTRDSADYGRGAVPGSINIPASRSFTTWAGSLLPYDRDLYLLVDDRRPDAVEQLARDLAGVGLDRVAGYFGAEAVEAWRKSQGPLQTIPSVGLEAAERQRPDGVVVLDVRGEGEWKAGHLPGSLNLPLGRVEERLGQIPKGRPVMVHCQTGSRAAMAASLLRARGFTDVRLFRGGFAEWEAAGLPVEI